MSAAVSTLKEGKKRVRDSTGNVNSLNGRLRSSIIEGDNLFCYQESDTS